MRQRLLNDLIPDVFYRELFMSSCLSGWQCGEEKHHYMALCHEVLSRSQLNALGKLKEAGIIANNLVVLPNASNISLANNGTHLSLGSRVLTGLMADAGSCYGELEEKHYGDLVIKICEHFLPLIAGTAVSVPTRSWRFWPFFMPWGSACSGAGLFRPSMWSRVCDGYGIRGSFCCPKFCGSASSSIWGAAR